MADEKKAHVEQKDFVTTYALQHDAYPNKALDGIDFIKLDYDECHESIIIPNEDRRQKKNQLPMIIQSEYEADISKYIVQLIIQFDKGKLAGTGTIIGIFQNKLFLLTCAHNVSNIKFGSAKNIWFLFSGNEASSTKFHVFPKYDNSKKGEMINDLAVIECKLSSLFQFYHIFPALKPLSAGEYTALIYGYPYDKKGELWGMEGKLKCSQTGKCSYDIDTTRGQSGSPIIIKGDIVGVHTNGNYLELDENYGGALTREKIQWINRLIKKEKRYNGDALQWINQWINQKNKKIYRPQIYIYNPKKNNVVVTIRSKYHGQYWCADNKNENQCFCNRKKVAHWERFTSSYRGNNKVGRPTVAFKSHHQKWVQIKRDNNGVGIHARANAVKTWEVFELHVVNAERNEYAIKCDNDKFISSREWGLNAVKSSKGATEVFIIQPLHE